MSVPIWQWSAVDTASKIEKREITSEEVVSHHVERMRAKNPALNAVVVDMGDQAIKDARAADTKLATGQDVGLLHGVPITIKENVDIAGRANPNGVPAMMSMMATEDSPVVSNLKKSGAIILGLTNTPEFSLRGFTDNPLHGLTLNPWDPEITCGGSSGGAASSLASGIGTLAHGNDIGGSLRWPAFCNGLATIRSTLGRVPVYNSSAPSERPLMAQLFSVQGPLGRSVADVRLGLEVMSQPDNRDPWYVPAPLQGPKPEGPIRVAKAIVPDDVEADPAILAMIDTAAEHLSNEGYVVEEVALPDLLECWQAWSDLLIGEVQIIQEKMFPAICSNDFMQVYGAYKAFSNPLDLESYMAAIAMRTRHLRKWMQFLEQYPVILCPLSAQQTFGAKADLEGDEAVINIFRNALRYIGVMNYLGLPAAAVPVGTVNGNPVGVQLVANRFREDIALNAAEAIERRAGIVLKELWARDDN